MLTDVVKWMVIGVLSEKDISNLPEVMTEDVTSVDITKLSQKMQRFIHLYMTGNYTLVKLSELLDVHPNTLGNWLRRKDVKTVIDDMEKSTHDIVTVQLNALTLKSVARLSTLIDSPIDGVAFQAVRDVLDRGGHRPKQEIKIDKTVVTFEQKLKTLIDDVIEIDDYEVEDD